MRQKLINVAVFVVCLQVFGCAQPANDAKAAGYLFVQVSQSGTFDGERLTLHDVSAQTVFFSDRPKRVAGHLPTTQFLEQWKPGGSFQSDPPNASLAFVTAGIESAVVLELQDPVLDGPRLSFRVRVLQGTPPASFADASLFIDAGGLMQLVAYGAQDVYGQ